MFSVRLRGAVVFFCAAGISLLSLACGDKGDEPNEASSAVRVGEVTIPHATMVRTMNDEWPVPNQYGGTKTKPPRYEACMQRRRPRTKAERRQGFAICSQMYNFHLDFAVRRTIEETWVKLALEERGIEPSNAEVQRKFEMQMQALPPSAKRTALSSSSARRKFRANVRYQLALERLSKALRASSSTLYPALEKLYGERTVCVGRYREIRLTHCTNGGPSLGNPQGTSPPEGA